MKRLLILLVLLWATSGTARAGTYTVEACRTADGAPQVNRALHISTDEATDWVQDVCTPEGRLGIAAPPSVSYWARVSVSPRFSSRNARTERIDLWRSVRVPAGSPIDYLPYWEPDACSVRSACELGTPDEPLAEANHLVWSPSGSGLLPQIGLEYSRSDEYCDPCSSGAGGRIDVYRLLTTFSDSMPPQVAGASGPMRSGPLKGNSSLTVSATDEHAGVFWVEVRMADRLVGRAGMPEASCRDRDPDNGGPFEFVDVDPCPTAATATVPVDVSGVPDGRHPIEVTAVDAAGQRLQALYPAVKVNNVPGPEALDPPTISGNWVDGAQATAAAGRYDPSDAEEVTTAQEWLRCDESGGGCQATGHSGPAYMLSSPDVGRTLRVREQASDASGTTTALSAPGPVVRGLPPAPEAGAPPVVSGVPDVKRILRLTSSGSWRGSTPMGTEVDWLRCDDEGTGCERTGNASDAEYRLTTADRGFTIVARVTRSNSAGTAYADSKPVGPVVMPPQQVGDAAGGDPPPAPPGEFAGALPQSDGGRASTGLSTTAGRESLTVAYGQSAVVTGRAEPGATVSATARTQLAGNPFGPLGSAVANLAGEWRLVIPPGPNRTVRFTVAGQDDVRQIIVLTRAGLSFRLSRARAVNGQSFSLRGRVLGRPVPARGVIVGLQVRERGSRWFDFRTLRTSRSGGFSYRHRFTKTFRSTRYELRAVLERQANYPYTDGASRPAAIRVRGRSLP